MNSTYRALAEFAQTWGLLYFVAVFAVVLAYALWPSRKQRVRRSRPHAPARGLIDGRTNETSTP